MKSVSLILPLTTDATALAKERKYRIGKKELRPLISRKIMLRSTFAQNEVKAAADCFCLLQVVAGRKTLIIITIEEIPADG